MSATTNIPNARSSDRVMYILTTPFRKGANRPPLFGFPKRIILLFSFSRKGSLHTHHNFTFNTNFTPIFWLKKKTQQMRTAGFLFRVQITLIPFLPIVAATGILFCELIKPALKIMLGRTSKNDVHFFILKDVMIKKNHSAVKSFVEVIYSMLLQFRTSPF